jgi:hypothetical protein
MGRIRLGGLTAVVAGALLLPAGAEAARGMEVAVQDDQVLVQRVYYDRDAALDHAFDLRATRIRVNVRWATAAAKGSKRKKPPRKITYDFRRWDDLIAAAGSRGIKVQLALTGDAPRWATGNRKKIGNHKPSARYFRHFAKVAAQHFKGRVDRYSIWNEPNHVGWIYPLKAGAKTYRELYRLGYKGIKSADPSADVLFGETAPYASKPGRATPPLKFLRQVLCVNRGYRPAGNCSPLQADGYAHHPYDYLRRPDQRRPGRDNVTMANLGSLTKALDRLAKYRVLRTSEGERLDVYLTEFGYFARGKYKLSEKTRAKYLVMAFDIAQRNKRVKQMLQYLLVQPNDVHSFFDTSIISRAGKLSRTFQKLRSWAAKAGSNGKIVVPEKPPPPPPPPEPEPEPQPPVPPPPVDPPPPPCDPLVDPTGCLPALF